MAEIVKENLVMIRAAGVEFLRAFVWSLRFFLRKFWLGPAQTPMGGVSPQHFPSQQPFSGPEGGPCRGYWMKQNPAPETARSGQGADALRLYSPPQ